MNFKQQLQEAYEAGYRQSLEEAAYDSYERVEINEEQLNEIIGFIGRQLAKLGLKRGATTAGKTALKTGTRGGAKQAVFGTGKKFKPMDPSLQKAFDDALGLKPGPITPVRPPITPTASQLRMRQNIADLKRQAERTQDLDDLLFGP